MFFQFSGILGYISLMMWDKAVLALLVQLSRVDLAAQLLQATQEAGIWNNTPENHILYYISTPMIIT